MGHLLLNSLAVHHSRAFHDLKKERPDQVDLLVSKHNSGETLTAQKQATGTKQKNSEQNAHYLLTILVTQELWALGILCLLVSIVDNRVPISYDYGGRTRLVACTRRIFASDTSTPTALGR